MTRCIAMLRGINVGGKSIKMDKLRASVEALGFGDVRTYIQSGNVLFDCKSKDPESIAKKIEKQILADFGLVVSVVVRTQKELAEVVKRNPFVKDKKVDQARLHVTFLSQDAPASAAQCLEELAAPSERYHIAVREVFLYCPVGYGTSKLANPFIERKLRVTATTRNWKTVNALLAMCAGEGDNQSEP